MCSAYLGTSQSTQRDRELTGAEVQNACPRAGFLFSAEIEEYMRELILRAAEIDAYSAIAGLRTRSGSTREAA